MGYFFLPVPCTRLQPLSKSGGVPMKDDLLKHRSAEKHDDPVAIDRCPQTRRRYVIKGFGAIYKPVKVCLSTIRQKTENLPKLEFPDPLKVRRKFCINVKNS